MMSRSKFITIHMQPYYIINSILNESFTYLRKDLQIHLQNQILKSFFKEKDSYIKTYILL